MSLKVKSFIEDIYEDIKLSIGLVSAEEVLLSYTVSPWTSGRHNHAIEIPPH